MSIVGGGGTSVPLWRVFAQNGIAFSLMHTRVVILGVPLDPLTRVDAVERLAALAKQDHGQAHVMTPNPEMLVAAQKRPAFRALSQRTTLNLPDGIGLLLAARYLGQSLPERVTGVDVLEDLCMRPSFGPVFFLGAAPGIAEQAARALQARNPSLRIAGTASLSPRTDDEAHILSRIRATDARVLFVAFGAPVQDEWIDRMLPRLPSVRLAMGVGGAFDFIAHEQKRAPRWMQRYGLEWLYRLVREPHRFVRIVRATVVFPWFVLRYRHRAAPLDVAATSDQPACPTQGE